MKCNVVTYVRMHVRICRMPLMHPNRSTGLRPQLLWPPLVLFKNWVVDVSRTALSSKDRSTESRLESWSPFPKPRNPLRPSHLLLQGLQSLRRIVVGVYLYLYTYTYIQIHIFVYLYIYTHVYIYIYVHARMIVNPLEIIVDMGPRGLQVS